MSLPLSEDVPLRVFSSYLQRVTDPEDRASLKILLPILASDDVVEYEAAVQAIMDILENQPGRVIPLPD